MHAIRTSQLAGLLMALLSSLNATAALTTIDFEGLPAMTYFPGSPIPESAKLSSQLLTSYGVTFSSADPYVAVVALGFGHATSGVNGIGASNGYGILTYDKAFPISFEFFNPVNPTTKAVTDFVSLRGDNAGSNETVFLRAYDTLGNIIAETSAVDNGGPTLSIAVQGIHSVRFFGTRDSGGVAVDDLTFGQLTIPSVPEPSSTVLALAGIVLLATFRKSRDLEGPKSGT